MTDTIATPNPNATQLTSASGISVLIGWAASVLAARYKIPIEVLGAGIAGITTIATSVWHRFFGPGVHVQKP
jgi:hypothetical protein